MEHTFQDNDPFEETSQLNMDAELSDLARQYLVEASKWAKFLAIVGFILCGLIVIGAIFMWIATAAAGALSSMDASSPLGIYGGAMGSVISLIYLAMGLLYFMPSLYMYRFATKTRTGIDAFSSEQLTEGMMNLKSLFKFMGITTIIVMGLYAMFIVFAAAGGLAGLMM